MLYLLKSDQVASRQRLAELIGTRSGNYSAPGKVAIVSGSALERLKQRLQEPQGFHSYGQIHQWLVTELGLNIAYKTVYELVRYRLKAKLKVPRPQSLKQHPESVAHFQKKFSSLQVLAGGIWCS
jgi:hypothetical protein